MPETSPSTLAAALAALDAAAAAAGVDPGVARAEGEALAATVVRGRDRRLPRLVGADRWRPERRGLLRRGLARPALPVGSDAVGRGPRPGPASGGAGLRDGPERGLHRGRDAGHPDPAGDRQRLDRRRGPAGRRTSLAGAAGIGRRPHRRCRARPGQVLTEDEMLRIAAESGRAVTQQLNAVRDALTKMVGGLGDAPTTTASTRRRPRSTTGPASRPRPRRRQRRRSLRRPRRRRSPRSRPRRWRSCSPSSTRWSASRRSRARSTARPRCSRRGQARGGRAQGPDDHPAPGLRRQPRHRQDHGRPAGRRHLPRARPAVQGPAGRGRPLRAGGRLPRPDRDEDRRGGEVRGGRRAVHRRGLLPGRRPVRHRGHRHPGQGDGGQARRPGRHRRRLPRADGVLHRPEPRAWRAGSAPPSSSPTTPTTSSSASSG